ncbi:MAG: bifunctional riboflavin kinase/FAD synthetase [Candidatus Hydrogenedens sp.]|nr:bifunctional riboflavin kinase/FAD synthetase [Candidatus Hydrogenedens sp.]
MQYIPDATQCRDPLPSLVLTIGSFDGVHLGHRAIMARVQERARELGGTAGLMTLHPHPRQVFSPDNAPNVLTSLAQKRALLEAQGMDAFFVLPFNDTVAAFEAERFLEEIILGQCGARHLIVGHDFAFGRGARGNFDFLVEAAPRLGFEVEEVPPVILHGERVSSTLIRECILQGELDKAELFLGRKYAMEGEVVKGRGMGRQLGYPTANIKPWNKAVPANGVYAAEAIVDRHRFVAAVNVGIAPTIRHEDITVEAFLLDFEGDLVRKEIEIVFHQRLRPEKKFDSLDALIAAIDDDVAQIRAYFEESGLSPA